MAHFEYYTFVCEDAETDLQAELDRLGLEGWRLHTCDPVVRVGPQGSGLLSAFVVMDKFIADEDLDFQEADIAAASEGIAMKG